MQKHYSLIVSGDHSYSIICDADQDAMTDYFPGIWSLSTQKSALKFARQYMDEGHTVTVRNYDNPRHYAASNKLIQALGNGQAPFVEPTLPKSTDTIPSGIPANLAQLKKYLTPGKHITAVNYGFDGTELCRRETSVISCKGDNLIVEKTLGTGVKSWMYFGKASEWVFDATGATKYAVSTDKVLPFYRIEYAG